MPRARPAHGTAAALSRSLPQGDAAGAAAQSDRPLPRPARPRHGKRCGMRGRDAAGIAAGVLGPRLTDTRGAVPAVAARRGAAARSAGEGGRPLGAQHPLHAVRLLPAVLVLLLHAVGRQERVLQLRAGDPRPVPAEGERGAAGAAGRLRVAPGLSLCPLRRR